MDKPNWRSVLSEIAWGPVVAITATPFAILTFYDFIRSELVPFSDQDKLQILRFLPNWKLETWLLIAALLFALSTVRGTYQALVKRRIEQEALLQQIADLNRQIEDRTPRLGLYVKEVLIRPNFCAAEVFVHAEISNPSYDTPATVREYALELTIAGKNYKSSRLVSDANTYEVFDVCDGPDEGTNSLQEIYENFQTLNDLSIEINHAHPVEYGAPRLGWLHFTVERLPSWRSVERGTGIDDWHQGPNTEDGEEPGEWIERTEWVPDIRSVTSAHTSIYLQGGSSSHFQSGVKTSCDRQVRKIKND